MITINVQDAEVFQLIRQIEQRGEDMKPVMETIAGIMKESVDLTFESEGRPGWPALAASTIAARTKAKHWPGKMLVSGKQGGMKANIDASQRATATQAILGTNKPYGPYLQFGTRKMRARPFLKLLPSDVAKIKYELMQYLFKRQ